MEKEAARYFLRKRFANGQEEMEYMSMEDAYHTMPQIMTEELIARHKGKTPNVIYVCRGTEVDGKESIIEGCNFAEKK